jgi:membrane protein implicated in regulation of membrane protease activity
MMQTRLESMIESVANIATGMLVSFVMGMLVYPLFGFDVSPGQNLWIVIIFTVVSFIRSYAWRRWFNGRLAKRLSTHG